MNSILNDYRNHARAHGVHTIDGDAEATNVSYDQLRDAFFSLVKNGSASKLFELFDDEDPWVQSWAAAHSLEVDESRALAKLDQLARAGIPHVSTSAKYAIQGWKSGQLRFLQPRP